MRRSVLLLLLIAVATAFELPPVRQRRHRVVVFGDLHGDLHNARQQLHLAQVVDDRGDWASGRDTVVQMGDVVDRGPHGHSILLLLERLQRQAAAAGGELVQMLGNHEVMNWRDDRKFVNPLQIEALGGVAAWRAMFQSPQGLFGQRLMKLPLVAVRNRTLFVHGGLLPQHARRPLRDLNAEMHAAMRERVFTHPLFGADSPIWSRQLLKQSAANDCSLLREVLQRVSRTEAAEGRPPVERVVVGHTIQSDGLLRHFCNWTLVATDIAVSQWVLPRGGHLGHLVIDTPWAASGAQRLRFIYPGLSDAQHEWTPPAHISDVVREFSDVIAARGSAPDAFAARPAATPAPAQAGSQAGSGGTFMAWPALAVLVLVAGACKLSGRCGRRGLRHRRRTDIV